MALTQHMIDLETLGKTPGCPIISIGIVKFDPFGNSSVRELIQNGAKVWYPNREEQQRMGLKVDMSTVDWWMRQSDKAREEFKKPQQPVGLVLDEIDEFLTGNKGLWCNGPSFDTPIIRDLYARAGRNFPVPYWNDRCCRTAKFYGGSKKFHDLDFEAHTALEDAMKQAIQVQRYTKLMLQYVENQLEHAIDAA